MATITRKIISTTLAPKPVAPYNQAVQVDHTLYLSGVVGNDVKTSSLVEGGVTPQAKKALENMGEILKAAGIDYGNVVKTTVYLADMNDFVAVNEVYKTFFKEPFPARSAFQVAKLPLGASVEIEAIAVVGKITNSL